jgi:hypothetical protein
MNKELRVARIPKKINTIIGGIMPELKKRDDANGIEGPINQLWLKYLSLHSRVSIFPQTTRRSSI